MQLHLSDCVQKALQLVVTGILFKYINYAKVVSLSSIFKFLNPLLFES